jgi:hypothetical protein
VSEPKFNQRARDLVRAAVVCLIEHMADSNNAPFIRQLSPADQKIAREYLLGLALHVTKWKAVPIAHQERK